MNIWLQVYLDIILIGVLSAIIVTNYIRFKHAKYVNKEYVVMVGVNSILLILEVISVKMNIGKTNELVRIVASLCNVMSFSLMPIMPICLLFFMKSWILEKYDIKLKSSQYLYIPAAINCVLALLSYNWGLVFVILENNIYKRGAWFWIPIGITYFYTCNNLRYIYQHQRILTIDEKYIFIFLNCLPAIMTAIQLSCAKSLSIWAITAILSIGGYIFILKENKYKKSGQNDNECA